MKDVSIIAQTTFWDTSELDNWSLPVGQWVDQAVDWVDKNMGSVLDVIRWPFQALFDLVVRDFLLEISWVWVILAFFVIGTLLRGLKVGTLAAVGLIACGLLGTGYWDETMRTIGLILIAVFLCTLVGIPIGIACGRFDGVWATVRPVLDAMQVIHTFVYMLPIIFFFSIGAVPATMVTMIFAVPPLIRLTNLGIRQVPEDVVEASRSFGATELRVLTDVQLPLARPAIMTGLNQTLLLAISMGGIAAIIGAGGLGLLVFRAVQNLDVALAGSAGLAFFLVAVVLDRMSQPGDGGGPNLISRIRTAWSNRKTPENLIGEPGFTPAPSTSTAGSFTPVGAGERIAVLAAAAGGVVAVVGTFLTWTTNASLVSSYSRVSDIDLSGQSFNGLAATGGSFFGILTLVAGLFVVASAVICLTNPGRGPRWFSAPGATLAAGMAFGASLGFLLAQPPEDIVDSFSRGPGAMVSFIGALVALAASWLWMWRSPISEIVPHLGGISAGRLAGAVVALLLLVISLYGAWSFDSRARTVLTPELQAQMDEIQAQVDNGELLPAVGAQQIQNLNNQAVASEKIVIDGKGGNGAELGWPALALGLLGTALLVPAAGFIRPRLTALVDQYRTAEAGSGRGVFAFFGTVLVAISVLWMYAVDQRGPLVLSGTFGIVVELLVIAAVVGALLVMTARAQSVAAETSLSALVGFGGIVIFLLTLFVAHGALPVISVVAVVAAMIAIGMAFGELTGEQQWIWSGLSAACGLALMGLSLGWILSIMRATDDKFYSGVGSACAFAAGFLLFTASRGILEQFGRSKVYGDAIDLADDRPESPMVSTDDVAESDYSTVGA